MVGKKAKQKSEKSQSQVNNILTVVVIILVFILVFSSVRRGQDNNIVNAPATQQEQPASPPAPVEKIVIGESEIDFDQKMKDFIMNNPKVILDSVSSYQNRQAQEREINKAKKLEDVYDDLIAHLPYVGPKNAEHEIIEFYDYNCGYCKQVVPVINKVLSERNDTKIYLVDFPILGQSSEALAKVSTAAYLLEPKKFIEVHNSLIKLGRVSISRAVEELTKIGFDKDELMKMANSKDVSQFLQKNKMFGNKISISGTPAFIVNKQFFGGALSYDAIVEVLDK